MSLQYLGLTLLVALPGVLHAQSPGESCDAPKLSNGYLVPDNKTYAHDTKLTYACDMGYRPAVEGWWATVTCQNGIWSHVPKCIAATACFPPEIANGDYAESSGGWFEAGQKLRIKCDEGYEHKDNAATTTCADGQWSSLPVCQKRDDSCDAPEIPHAVIIGTGYKEVFAADSSVQYECEDGYTAEVEEKKLICIAGTWSEGPTCSKKPEPGTGQGGSAEVGPSDGHTTSTGRETQPSEIGCVVPARRYAGPGFDINLSQDLMLKERERRLIACYWAGSYSLFQCNNGGWSYSLCCTQYQHEHGRCHF